MQDQLTAPMALASNIADLADGFENLLLASITEWPTSHDEPAIAEWRERIHRARQIHAEIGAALGLLQAELPSGSSDRDQLRRLIAQMEAEAEKGSTRMRVFLRQTAALWRERFQNEDGDLGWPADLSN